MRAASTLAAVLLGLACSGAAASSFYLFPVKEIEGVARQGQAARALVDPRVIERVFGGADGQRAQRSVIDQFVARLHQAYPNALVHPKQVYDVNLGGAASFVNDDNLQCKQAPSVNVADTYAVVVGITRASLYEVVKGDNVEVLIPVTLSLQLIKPNLAKVAYTISDTLYSPFRLSIAEYESGAADAVIRKALVANIGAQVGSLVAAARQAFNPKEVPVALVDRDGKFFVTNQGMEAGFVKGEQVEARDAAGKVSVFDVLYVDSGYAVVQPVAGSPTVGDRLQFLFETSADDSRKPLLLPVVAHSADDSWASAVSDIFSRDLGFKAPFQLSPVDVNFSQTKDLVTRAANCVSWQNLPSMAQASGVRKDRPDFLLRFSPVVSAPSTLSGSGGTRTSEMFHTLVTAQVVDQFGKVIFSELGDNAYSIERVNGDGLGFAQAREISLKNATRQLARNFVANVRFVPRDYPIVKVDRGMVWVEGLGAIDPVQKLTFDILHPLDARAAGKPAMLDLEAGAGAGLAQVDGDRLGLSYSAANPALPTPRRGDVLRLYLRDSPGASAVQDCDEAIYVGQNNVAAAPYLGPLIQHVLYQSPRFASHIGDPRFYVDANALLRQGMFDLQIERPALALCSQPGYAIREEALHCENPENCKATVSMGMVVRLKRGAQIEKTYSSGLRTEFSGFQAANKGAFYGYRQLGNGLSMQADLLKKLNQN